MVVRDSSFSRTVGILAILTLIGACGGSKSEPQTTPPQESEPPETVVETAEPSPETAPEPAEQLQSPVEEAIIEEPDPQDADSPQEAESVEDDDSIVMIDTGASAGASGTESLVEAARAERDRRQTAPPSEIVITDETLSEYATGELTVAAGPANSTADQKTEPDSSDPTKLAQDEAYWRNGAREIRMAWNEAVERVEELEGKVFDLRQRFYREDDGFYRDGQIKPAWDRAIEQLEAARREVEERQEELELFLEEGRQAGALAGWLREGIELEPIAEEETDNISEPEEPVIYQDDGSHDPP